MNNKPRYTQGTIRSLIVNLLHVTGVITPRCYKLMDNASIANVICKMKKEGVIEKCNNGMVFECFNLANYESNLDEYFELPYIDYEYFIKFGKHDVKRAKYAKDEKKGNSIRIIRSAEITVLMYCAGIPTLPSDKESVVQNKVLTSAVYYQSREIKHYAGYRDEIQEQVSENKRMLIASRINGTLLSAGGNYNVYHIGKDLQLWNATGEYKIKNQIENLLSGYINQSNCRVQSAILYTYDQNIFLKLVNPKTSYGIRFASLANTYNNIYILPFDRNGRDMTQIMAYPDWEVLIKELAIEKEYDMTAAYEYACDYYEDGKYVYIFCVPNITRYLLFLRKVIYDISAGTKTKDDFEILCFDFQQEFVLKSASNYANVLSCEFEEFMNDWNRIESNKNKGNDA